MLDEIGSPDANLQSSNPQDLVPDLFLLQYLSIIPRGIALDLGAGKGRNSIFLAENGFEVDAFDRSPEAVSALQKEAQERSLPIRAIKNELTTLTIIPNRYSLALAAWVLMFLRRGEREGLVKMTLKGLLPGGIVYLGVFSIHDPGYEMCKEQFEEIKGEERTFFVAKRKMPVHYFTVDEVRGLLKGLELIALSESFEMDITHGEPHYHGRIEVLARVPQ